MKFLTPLTIALLIPTISFAASKPVSQNAIADIIDALNAKENPTCYHFTDEVPPEEFIGLPECSLQPPEVTGAVEIGAFFNTSDNDYFIAKVRSDLNHEIGKLRSNWIFDMFARKSEVTDGNSGEKDYETTDQKWLTSLQSNYTIEEGGQNYLFGFAAYEDDRFNAFDYQSSVAAGWGRRWYETDTAYLDAEVGPGLKIEKVAATDDQNGRTDSAAIIRMAATYEQRFFATMQFKQTLSAEIAPENGENSKLKSVSSITTKLIESLALKFAFSADHNTDVEGNVAKTRTETSLTLVYSI
ncbi:YdiY family protein [Thalassotalea maritima]|uniref:DUF481 domain-containing protein n=1 Tax=Thalassotalea maritima TaxID=3242416 RepID=UPI0035299B95